MIKIFVFILFLFSVYTSLGQSFSRNKIDRQISIIDSIESKVDSFKIGKTYYRFLMKQGRILKISRNFSTGPDAIGQEFYLHNDTLLFSTESIITHFGQDSIGWSGGYYFERGKLKDYETLGHGKSETEEWNPEGEVIGNFNRSLKDVKGYLKRKTNNSQNRN